MLPPAVDFLPAGRATLTSAVLLCAIHSAAQEVELQEGVNFFFFDHAAGVKRRDNHRRRREFGDASAVNLSQRPTVLPL